MKKIDVGQAIQIIGNVDAIAGTVFLALELRQSNFCGAKRVPVTARRSSRVESLGIGASVLSTHDS